MVLIFLGVVTWITHGRRRRSSLAKYNLVSLSLSLFLDTFLARRPLDLSPLLRVRENFETRLQVTFVPGVSEILRKKPVFPLYYA